uniref:Uncharacterized protein LOC111122170 isoform X3 n=1 Tax=Crassostrea virginica TaxID=6565 RepID=A0A8B8CW64_CRAVI|nr:uncharacterized protein LOC111122170 isoform X3 [Crassostrea virginica]
MAKIQIFTGSQLNDGQMLPSFKRYLHKELQKRMELKRNDVLDSREYNFRHDVRGIAVVISNEKFCPDSGNKMESREYAEEELRKMKEMFSGLGFIVMLFKDLTAQQMYEVIQTVTSKEMDFFFEKSDAFACVLASHGNEVQEENPTNPNVKVYHHVIYGTDRAIRTHLLMDLLKGNRCRQLRGKPKLFFIQACRSRFSSDPSRFDQGVNISNNHSHRGRDKKESALDKSEDVASNENISTSKPDKVESSDGDKVLSNEKLRKNAQSPNGGECNENIQQNEESDKMERTTELYRRLSIDDDVVPCLTVEIVQEKTKDNCEDSNVQEETKDNCEDSNVQEETKDICEDSNVIERSLNWVRKRVYRKSNEKPRMKHHLDSMTTVMTPCHNDFLVMYSTSQGKAGFGRDGEGGWLLHVMHGFMAKHIQHIRQHNDNCLDFLLVMTQVMDHICVHFETNTGSPTTSGLKTAPTLQHKLSNDLIFRNKYILN